MTILDRLDERIALAGEERMLLDSVRQLAREQIAPRAEHFDRTSEFPWENVRAINELGLNAMFVPEAYGGAQMSYTAYLACVREISKACAATGIVWATNYHGMKPLIDWGTEEQKQRLLPRIAEGGLGALAITEPGAGSDATGMRTTFREDGDQIVINGGKTFITNGDVADLYLLFGKWEGIAGAKESISVLVLEKGAPGLSVVRLEDKMGTRASSTATLAFDNVRVPRANLLGQPGDGLKILFASLNKSRPSVAAHALGIARAAFEDAVAYINERRQSGRKIIEFQGIQFMIADLASELALVESWRRQGLRHRSLAAEDARHRSRDAHFDRRRAAAGRLRLLQGLPRGAPDARRQDHADLGRDQPGPPPIDRAQLPPKMTHPRSASGASPSRGRPQRPGKAGSAAALEEVFAPASGGVLRPKEVVWNGSNE
jgi:acyl-CoA dehydrogenase